MLETVFAQNLPHVSRFRAEEEEDDPAYFESERKHIAPPVNVKIKGSEGSMGDLGRSRRKDSI